MMLLTVLALAAVAPPQTHLSCAFDENGPEAFNVTVDEPNSSVVLSRAPDYLERVTAAFTPTELRFDNGATFVIDRVALSAKAWVNAAGPIASGKCKVLPTPPRAF